MTPDRIRWRRFTLLGGVRFYRFLFPGGLLIQIYGGEDKFRTLVSANAVLSDLNDGQNGSRLSIEPPLYFIRRLRRFDGHPEHVIRDAPSRTPMATAANRKEAIRWCVAQIMAERFAGLRDTESAS